MQPKKENKMDQIHIRFNKKLYLDKQPSRFSDSYYAWMLLFLSLGTIYAMILAAKYGIW
jgi:hypothetical protein